MTKNIEQPNLYDKINNVIAELKAPKTQYNNFGKYKYRSTEDILEAVKPLLFKYKCNLRITDEVQLIGERFYIKATAELYDNYNNIVTTGLARESNEKKGMDSSQITGAASSYARKYALNGLFCIDDTKDADGLNDNDDLKGQLLEINSIEELNKFYKENQNKVSNLKEFVKLCTSRKQAIEGQNDNT